ncbi:NAD(P)-binding protein [Lophiostoma macrostomum CBS 122681]|uniref:NAD(P)-binding protein n=1 Tax=Lophiostoma macrostomum CBS 122681 TaxID=1314788 RepID=A0A6A6SLU3_9PLEO|nr:NAD(P)-binding protein [Lophiostoma macrostomum CBS 122681]
MHKGVALITGGASGMGFGVAERLCRDGWAVVVVDLNEQQGAKAIETLGRNSAHFIRANVTDYREQASAFEEAVKVYGRLDFVFANAGIIGKADFYDHADQLLPKPPSLAVQDICLTGVIYTSHLALNYMRRNSPGGGVIVMTASAASLYATPDLPIYTSSKHGVLGLMRSMSVKLEKEGIRVNCILPGAIKTSLFSDDKWSQFGQDDFTPLEEIVEATMQLLNDKTATGKAIEISKGEVFDRQQPPFCNSTMERIMTGASY